MNIAATLRPDEIGDAALLTAMYFRSRPHDGTPVDALLDAIRAGRGKPLWPANSDNALIDAYLLERVPAAMVGAMREIRQAKVPSAMAVAAAATVEKLNSSAIDDQCASPSRVYENLCAGTDEHARRVSECLQALDSLTLGKSRRRRAESAARLRSLPSDLMHAFGSEAGVGITAKALAELAQRQPLAAAELAHRQRWVETMSLTATLSINAYAQGATLLATPLDEVMRSREGWTTTQCLLSAHSHLLWVLWEVLICAERDARAVAAYRQERDTLFGHHGLRSIWTASIGDLAVPWTRAHRIAILRSAERLGPVPDRIARPWIETRM